MRTSIFAYLFVCCVMGVAGCESYFLPENRESEPLKAIRVDPDMYDTDVPRNAPLRITLNKHLDSGTFSTRALSLHSGESSKRLYAHYNPLDRQLVVWTSSSMVANTVWELSVDSSFRAVDGSAMTEGVLTRFRTGTEKIDTPIFIPRTWASDVKPLFDSHCVSCHGSNGYMGLNLQTISGIAETATNIASVQWPKMALVSPNRPGASYLVYKLLDDDTVSGRRMPRTMTDEETAEPLTDAEIRTIIDWILGGALF